MLSGRVALIAGVCDHGIGRSTALTLALQGARIALGCTPHNSGADAKANADNLIATIRDIGGEALAFPLDSRRPETIAAWVGAAVAEFGAVDMLVSRVAPIWDASAAAHLATDALDAAVQAEIEGTLLCIQACLPVMRQNGWGRIVAIGPFEPVSWIHGRSATHARRFLAQHFERRERPHNITANLIHPGWGGVGAGNSEAALAAARHEPAWEARRHTSAQDIADAVLFLCSEAARFITGSQLFFALE
ncbi:MAG TPA: SDR family oxidoreductase [Aggregatilineaceae bacterium]|nr:SDR family oxidoreductase [Anaerolineae bacterium]HMM28253.1 SDR family oxidoreductase [Aggregatilineaceae bacterium]